MKSHSGVESRRLQFRELLWEWINIVERSARLWTDDDDSAWLYNERASVSIFAGEVWRVGGVAFEEFSTDKYLDPTAPETALGRGDLFFQLCNKDYIAEAKQCRASAVERSQPKEIVGKAMKAAVSDTEHCKLYFDYQPIALVFATPQLTRSHIDNSDSLLRKWVEAIREVEHHSLACTFPEAAKTKQKNDRFYPGVALLICDVSARR